MSNPLKQTIADFHSVFTTEPGKRVLQHILDRTCHGQPCHMRGQEPWQAAYRDGAQSVAQFILDYLATPPNTDPTPTIKKPQTTTPQ
jgi:hypothetical protein